MKKLLPLVLVILLALSACQMEYVASLNAGRSLSLNQAAQSDSSISSLSTVIKLLQKEYYHQIDITALLNGAVKGINYFIKEKKLGDKPLASFPPKSDPTENYRQLIKDYENLVIKHPRVSKTDLVYTALIGMMGALDDPYSTALTPKENKTFNEQMQGGNFTGIGVYLELDPENHNQLTVTEPIEGSPAYEAGLRVGDQIIMIDGLSTKGIAIDQAAQKIRGPENSTVVLTIKRGKESAQDYSIVRRFIHVSSAVPKLYKGEIGYIKLRVFGENTREEFGSCLDKLQQAGAKAVIVDLRNNGGGYVQAAIDICSFFFPSGKLVTSVVEPRQKRNSTYTAYQSNKVNLPVVILINRYSASASEIVAGAFRDQKIGLLVGEKSFGKGSVQSIFELGDGGAVKYTIAHYLTPSGQDIHKKGIKPDVEVPMEVNLVGGKKDIQLMKAIKILKQKISPSACLPR